MHNHEDQVSYMTKAVPLGSDGEGHKELVEETWASDQDIPFAWKFANSRTRKSIEDKHVLIKKMMRRKRDVERNLKKGMMKE